MSLYQDYSLEQLKEKVVETNDNVDLHIELIKRFVTSENLEGAIHQANQTNELMPGNVEVQALKAFCLVNLGHADKGMALLDSLVRQNAHCEFQNMIQNEIAPLFYQNVGQVSPEEYLLDKIESAPEEQKRVFERIQSLLPVQEALGKGELNNAVQLLQAHLEDFPEDLNAEMELALVFESLGRHQESAEIFRKVIQTDPSSSSAYFGLALVTADPREAVELSRRGLELAPDQHCERYNLGVNLSNVGEFDAAKQELSRVPADEPIYPYALSVIGQCFVLQDDLTKAIEYQEKAVTLAAHDPELHAQLGGMKIEAGLHGEGLESLERAIELEPNSIPVLMLRAYSLDSIGQTEDAISSLDEAMKSAPENFSLNLGLGVFYYRQEDFEKSIHHSLQAIEANCEAFASYWNAAVSYARLEQRDQCLKYLKDAVERNPEVAGQILSDDDLEAYWEDPEFQSLAQTI